MITRDEQESLPSCLEAARPLFDELCVVDTGSKDQTISILEDFQARIVHRPWRNDFAWARNESLALATHPWVVVLDADEIMTPELVHEIRKSVQNHRVGAISLLVRDPQPSGEHRETRIVRAWRNHPTIRYHHRIHEDISLTLFPFLKQEKLFVDHLAGHLLHDGYSREVAGKKHKKMRDASILLECLREDPSDLYNWFKLCEIASFWNDISMLRKAVTGVTPYLRKLDPQEHKHFVGELCWHIHRDADHRRVPFEQQLRLFSRINSLFPKDIALLCLLGVIFERNGDWERAEFSLRAAMDCLSTRPHDSTMRTRARLALTRVYLASGRLDQARNMAEIALECAPKDPEALYSFFALSSSVADLRLRKKYFLERHQETPASAHLYQEVHTTLISSHPSGSVDFGV